MPRYKLTIEYDGAPFVGWQHQRNGRSVQEAVERAIAAFAGEGPRVQCAGRTDAGVHATGPVAHVDLARAWPVDTVRDAINAKLKPAPIAVLSAEAVADSFNARTSATGRRYLYRILNRRPPPTVEAGRVWHLPWRLDASPMAEAAATLLGFHDFTTFRSTDCQANSPWRTLERFHVERAGDEIRVEAAARSFLHHQVRAMVGTIALAGAGKWSVAAVRSALDARRRDACGPMAPPGGLYLTGVVYPPAPDGEA